MKDKQKIGQENIKMRPWKKVWRYMWECIMLSFLAAFASYLIISQCPACAARTAMNFHITKPSAIADAGVLRALAFFLIGYLTIVPIYFIRTAIALKELSIERTAGFGLKLRLTSAVVVLSFGFMAFPYMLLKSADVSYWKVRVAYNAVTASYIGLSMIGGAVLCVVVMSLWSLFCFIPLMWTKKN